MIYKMRKLILILIFSISLCSVWASSYNVQKPQGFKYSQIGSDEEVLFILDFSNSMTEELEGKRKVDLMVETMSQILPLVNRNIPVGLRVYGNRMGITQYDACHASSLLVPIAPGNTQQIQDKLAKTKPRGMTPITYSLQKAVDIDFMGFNGKKHIVLLTDGGENCDESPCTWAMKLIQKRKDVNIDVIAFNMFDKDDLDQLECTALVTGGKFNSTNTKADLVKSLQNSLNIKKQVNATIKMNP